MPLYLPLPNGTNADSREQWYAKWESLLSPITDAMGATFFTVGTTAFDYGTVYFYVGEQPRSERIGQMSISAARALYECLTGHPYRD